LLSVGADGLLVGGAQRLELGLGAVCGLVGLAELDHGHLQGLIPILQLLNLLLPLDEGMLQIALDQPKRVDIPVELLHFGLPLGQVLGELAILMEECGVLFQQEGVFDLEVLGGAQA
jgi:hypothetical protein